MSTRVRLVLLSLVITLLVMWLSAISYAEPIEVRGKLVSRDDQTKRVEFRVADRLRCQDGSSLKTLQIKGIPLQDLDYMPLFRWGLGGIPIKIVVEIDNSVKYPKQPYDTCMLAATFVKWSGRMAKLVEEGKALAAQKAEQEAQAKREAAEREKQEAKKAAEREEQERKEAAEKKAREEREAREAAERAEQERKASLERAAKAEREAKEAAEREARKQQELEAQPPRQLVGKALSITEGNTVFVEVGALTYKVRNVSPICLVADEEIKVTVRRVDPDHKSEILYHCDFVSFDPDWQKAQDKKVAEAKSKEESLKAKEEKLQSQKDELIAKLQAEQEKLESYREATTLFSVTGKVTGKEKNALQLWGHALPSKGAMDHWAQQTREANIVVINPQPKYSGGYYMGLHYFVKKASGKNAYGGSVPIWVFGDLPPKVKGETDKITSDMEKHRTRILEIEQEVKSLSSEMGKVVCIPEK